MRKKFLDTVSAYATLIAGDSMDRQAVEQAARQVTHDAAMKKAHNPLPMRRPLNITPFMRYYKPTRRLVVIQENVAQHMNREGKQLTHVRLVRESETKVSRKILPTPLHQSIDLLFAKKIRYNQKRAELGRWCN